MTSSVHSVRTFSVRDATRPSEELWFSVRSASSLFRDAFRVAHD